VRRGVVHSRPVGSAETFDPFLTEVTRQPAALRRAVSTLSTQHDELEALTKAADLVPVFTGMGASYHACYPAVTALASKGRAALHVDAGELLHFRRPVVDARTIVVAVSQSGRSAEVVRLAEELRRTPSRPLLLAVCNGRDNPLARLADLALDTGVGEETGPSTMTLVASLAALSVVTGVLIGDPVASVTHRVGTEVELAAQASEKLLAAPVALADRLADHLEGRSAIVVLGRGPGRAAAEAGALLLKEVAALPAQSLSTAQFRHGPLELAGERLAVVLLATEPETADLDLTLAAELAKARSAVVVVSAGGDALPGTLGVAVSHVQPTLAPVVSVVPIELLAWALASRLGRIPGTMTRATKVTTSE
jgi:glutamine---fructose-6-phosphate transaminase (isomerizing)